MLTDTKLISKLQRNCRNVADSANNGPPGIAKKMTKLKHSALEIAARSMSTSYRDVLSSSDLAAMLRSGVALPQYEPHLMSLLDEIPLPLVARLVDEVATSEVTAQKITEHLAVWSEKWKTHRSWG